MSIIENYDKKAQEEAVIKYYEEQEQTMILLFCQWCTNHELDPVTLYKEAYPEQLVPKQLEELKQETVEKEAGLDIDTALLIDVMSQFNNHDLAFVVSRYDDLSKKQQK
ncbi:hypothetical protein GCM10012290_12710 [Halolactibacillus alkaliphilus]|uniref:Uncharacterized protein n=1 Tax=Halolactibacillus alkaliphilus TaxID=442899 RepID=A0A511X0X2_9BACI|nr:hypothetical protein [Halolactibacillus alkaliphilus]GEN56598.1 hypothetical protein HAL01_10620 [Halolactibacillus alkaliphilus]GGN69709.1 hypothetical protein GCM10012290_12710 [Halolactibacillus alkaliphilus]SFO76310.1 hypothetical protein SAMN05720591_10958 [Halolactibacillus alkaliphilus]